MTRLVTFADGTTVPALGQGTWELGDDPAWRDEEQQALARGIDLGMTLIDTAELYGDGRSERLVGEVIADRRDEVFLVSKVRPENASEMKMMLACEKSLERHRQGRHGREHVGPQQGAMPGHRRAPVVTHHDAGRLAQRPDQIDHVPDQVQDGIGVHARRLLGPAITPHIGGRDVVSCLRQGLDLGPPADPQFGKAVDQQDQRRVLVFEPGVQNLLDQAVGLDKPRSHSTLFRGLRRF